MSLRTSLGVTAVLPTSLLYYHSQYSSTCFLCLGASHSQHISSTQSTHRESGRPLSPNCNPITSPEPPSFPSFGRGIAFYLLQTRTPNLDLATKKQVTYYRQAKSGKRLNIYSTLLELFNCSFRYVGQYAKCYPEITFHIPLLPFCYPSLCLLGGFLSGYADELCIVVSVPVALTWGVVKSRVEGNCREPVLVLFHYIKTT